MVMIKIKIGRIKKYQSFRKGSILIITVIGLIILTIFGLGILNVAFGVRLQAIVLKNETSAMLAAEAGYERAMVWMEQQPDVISSLAAAGGTVTGPNTFFTGNNSSYNYSVRINPIGTGSRVVYRIVSNGRCGTSDRTVRGLVMQAVSGWDMGVCQVPSGTSSTTPVYFKTGEIIDMPLHINKDNTNPASDRDIYISAGNTPRFLREVEMGESKGSKYPTSIMNLFEGGISFDQPDGKITDETVINTKMTRFASTATYTYTPAYPSNWNSWKSQVNGPNAPAVQLEFFVDPCGVGRVRITNNCVVRGYTANTYDYRIKAGTGGAQYEKYNIYGCHYIPYPRDSNIVNIANTYVTPSYGGSSYGLIYVNGNVVMGSAEENAATIVAGGIPASQLNTVKGNVTVVATGNIWIANSLTVAGDHDSNGMPTDTNPNMLSMLSGTTGVIKVIDPKIQKTLAAKDINVSGTIYATYEPTGLKNSSALPSRTNDRKVLNPMVVEAGMIVGGGGWGAENVDSRQESSGTLLTVRGTITERVRGVVGQTKGFLKDYHFDERLLEGYLPEDMRLKGKYIPVPAGWHDYRN
jgi:hypothetical protein